MSPSGFSVLMTVYKNDDPIHFERAIRSVTEEQTVMPSELVLIVDGPVPNELKITIEQLNISALKVFWLSENVGLGKALNYGLNEVSQELVARMDSDDISLPERFEKQLERFRDNRELVISGGFIEEFGLGERSIRKVPLSHKEIISESKKRNPFNHMTVMFKKENIISCGGYKHMPFYEDYYLWNRLINDGAQTENLEEILVLARVNNGMIERRSGLNMALNELRFQRELLKLGHVQVLGFIIYGLPRVFLRVVPRELLKKIYLRFLRN